MDLLRYRGNDFNTVYNPRNDYVGSVFWIPSYDGYVYTRATISWTVPFSEEGPYPIGSREIRLADAEGQGHTCVACDPAYDFDALGWVDGALLVRRMPFAGDDESNLRIEKLCDYADCSQAEYYLIDWETGEWLSSSITGVPPVEPAPDLEAEAVYTAPSGEWYLVPGIGGVGLWRVFADDRSPEIVVSEGTQFAWVAPDSP